MSGKGSKQRPTDLKKFGKNYEKAFGTKPTKAEIDRVTGAIKLETISSEVRQKRKVKLIKEYVDQNGVEMVIVNINDALTNKVITKGVYNTLNRDNTNEDAPKDDIVDAEIVEQPEQES